MDYLSGQHLLPDPNSQPIKMWIALPEEEGTSIGVGSGGGGVVTPTTNENCVRIAWTADALPTSSHGELKISLRYNYSNWK